MKSLVLVLLMLLIIAPDCAAGNYEDMSDDIGNSGYSPAVHIGIGALSSGLTLAVIPERWELNPWLEGAIAVGVSLAVGGVIESLDEDFEIDDFLGYGAGGLLSVTIIKICF